MNSGVKTTIETLARDLGLATSTVSRALNDYSDISEETRRRVREAAELSGYRAGSERKSKKARSNTVGLVVEMWALDISSPFFGQFLRGLTAALRRGDYDLLVTSTDGPKEALKAYEYLIAENRVDAFVLTRVRSDDPRIDLLMDRSVPFVCYGQSAEGGDFAWHDVDAGGAASDAIDYLVKLGHTRIGHIQAPRAINFVRLRQDAYRAALTRNGIAVDDALQIEAGVSPAAGVRGINALLELDEPPTAVICDLDALAIGAMSGLRNSGLVPGIDISFIGYGDDPFAAYVEPPLSTFSQDAELSGRWVAEMTLATISGTTPAILQRMRPASFKERLSAAKPPRGPADLRVVLDKRNQNKPN